LRLQKIPSEILDILVGLQCVADVVFLLLQFILLVTRRVLEVFREHLQCLLQLSNISIGMLLKMAQS